MLGKKIAEITQFIGNKEVVISLEELPLEKLCLDPSNPRFAHTLDFEGKRMTDKEMEKELWGDEDTRALYKNIIDHGGLIEEPWITTDGIVLEGCRRLVCLRKICEDIKAGKLDLSLEKFGSMRCKVLPSINEVDIRVLRTMWHVTGKKEWPAINQAKLVYQLAVNDLLIDEKLALKTGLSIGDIRRRKWAYAEMLKFIKMRPSLAKPIHYSYFDELHRKRSNLYSAGKFIAYGSNEVVTWGYITSSTDVGEFYDLVIEGKLGGSEGVRTLPEIVRNPEAYEALKKDGLEVAREVLNSKKRAVEPPKSTEQLAMEVAMKYERKHDREPKDVSPDKCGYDIESEGISGKRYIEVKGFSGSLEDLLTYSEYDWNKVGISANEWDKAHELEDDYWLYIVVNAQKNPKLYGIRNPVSVLDPDDFKFKIKTWLSVAEQLSSNETPT